MATITHNFVDPTADWTQTDVDAAIARGELPAGTLAANMTKPSHWNDTHAVSNIVNADIGAAAAIDASKIADGSVSSTEFQYINSLTSNAQTQINAKQATLSGASLTAVTVATDDKVLIQDTSDSNNLKTVTAQSIADLSPSLGDGDKGDITVSSSGTVWTIDNAVVTLAKQADVATSTVFYRKTAGTGAPEVNTLATLKTDLGLTGTNTGDQTITLTGGVTGSGTGSFATTLASGIDATKIADGTVTSTEFQYINTLSSNAQTQLDSKADSSFKTISVAGQSDVVADSSTDTLTLAAGANVTLTTNAGTDTITIASTGGGTNNYWGSLVYANTTVPAGNTVTSTSETAFTSSYTIPAATLAAGDVIRVKMFGVYSGTVLPTIRGKMKFGSTVMLDTTAISGLVTGSNIGWWAEGLYVVQTAGASGAIESQGYAEFGTAATTGLSVNTPNSAAITVDTTASQTITATIQWGAGGTGQTITLREMTVEVLRANSGSANSVANGGTGNTTLTANSVLLGEGTSAIGFATVGTAGRVFVDKGAAADPAFVVMSGDATINSSGAITIANSAVTLAKQADMATASVVYRKTAGSGAPEVNTLATLKTDLGLTGTNSGDQTITLTGEATGSGTGSFATTLTNSAVIGKVLTGYVSGAGTVAATDTILQAIQKLNGNDATNANLTGAVTSVGNASSLGSFTFAQLNTAISDADVARTDAANTFTGVQTMTSPAITTPAITGLATGSGVASAATVSTLASRDANGNSNFVNVLEGYTTTASAAGTTTLTVASNYQQVITGSTTQTVQMPVASTLAVGQSWQIVNNSTGAVTVNTSAGSTNAITVLATGTSAVVECILASGTTTASWTVLNPSLQSANGGQIAGFRNYIINGDFKVWQRGTSFALTTTVGTYNADRWSSYQPTVAAGISNRDTSVPTTPATFQYSLKVGRTAANTATNHIYLNQVIESVNCYPLRGQQVTLSFYAKAGANYSNAGSTLSVQLYTGTGVDQGTSSIGTWTGVTAAISQPATLTTSWQRFSYTAILGATISEVAFQADMLPVGTAGADDNYYITGIQLEVGTVATPFENRPFSTEQDLCRRYYEKTFAYATAPAQNAGTAGAQAVLLPTGASGTFGLSVPMYPKRTAPTITTYNPSVANANWRDSTGAADRTVTVGTIGETSFVISGASGVASTTNLIHWAAAAEL